MVHSLLSSILFGLSAGEMTSSYKKKKEADQKSLSGSSHNWNALFLGANAVADVMAERLVSNFSVLSR